MPAPPDLTHLDSASPSVYLKDGFRSGSGKLRPELTGLAAFGIALQFERAGTSPGEVGATLEALRQLLPMAVGAPEAKFSATVEEALDLVRRLLNVSNSSPLSAWLWECAGFAKTEADIAAFLEHFQAVMLQYATLIRTKYPTPAPAQPAGDPEPVAGEG